MIVPMPVTNIKLRDNHPYVIVIDPEKRTVDVLFKGTPLRVNLVKDVPFDTLPYFSMPEMDRAIHEWIAANRLDHSAPGGSAAVHEAGDVPPPVIPKAEERLDG